MAVPNMIVTLVANTTKFVSGMSSAGNRLTLFGRLTAAVGHTVRAAVLGMTLAFVRFSTDAIKSASNLEQSVGGVESVFKRFSNAVIENSKAAAESVGLSMESYQRVGTMTATLLKNAGVPMKRLVEQTDILVTLAADLAATFGGTVEEAATAMNAALRGEFEPIRRFGISLSIAQIQEKALAMTHKESIALLSKRDKILATQALLLQQGADASGQFSRESDTLANRQQVLNAKWENLSATMGEKLLPIAETLTDALIKLVDSPGFKKALDNLIQKFEDFGEWLNTADGQKTIDTWTESIIKFTDSVSFMLQVIKDITNSDAWKGFWGLLRNPAGQLTDWLSGGKTTGGIPNTGNPSAPGGHSDRIGMKSGSSVIVNFNSPVDSVSAGREISRVLSDYNRANGYRG